MNDVRRPDYTTARAARAAGEERMLGSAVIRHQLERLRRGVYLESSTWKAAGPDDRFRLRVLAVCETHSAPVFCRDAAAALWHLPSAGSWPDLVPLLAPPDVGGYRSAGVRVLRRPPEVEIIEIDGVRLTSFRQTVADQIRSLPFRDGVALADAAVRRLTAAELAWVHEYLDRHPRLHGVTRANAVLAFADGRSESVLESISRVGMHLAGLPTPILQHRLVDDRGFVARLDFYFEDENVGGESDGDSKYLDARLRGGRSAARTVLDEKLREDRARARLSGLARWGFAAAAAVHPMLAVLARAGVRPTGHPRRAP